jgi:Pvc16 N-terminal domain
MIFAATQSLAEFLTNTLPMIEKEHISFEHPQVLPTCRLLEAYKPCLNLYCYHIQESWCSHQASTDRPSSEVLPPLEVQLDRIVDATTTYRWFELTFLVSITDHTVLGEQHLLSDIVELLSNHHFLPEQVVAPELRGLGQLPLRISSPAIGDTLTLWQVLQAPLRLSLQITLTVPTRGQSWPLYP